MRLAALTLCATVMAAAYPATAGARAETATDESSAYLRALTAEATRRDLAHAPVWLVLLHYRGTGDGARSEADGPEFFFAGEGASDPAAELAATLAAFFQPAVPADGKALHPQCRFPARYFWLDSQLGFDAARLPRQPCPRFERWRRTIDARGASMVYADAYLNNPASMFGHTFLRLDRAGEVAGGQLLSYILNYSARATTWNAFAYVVLGLTGGFDGHFTIVPYYLKVAEYSAMENRDLWVYHLDLTAEEVAFLVMHAWELGATTFDYFYLDENCSYHILSLLEAARPELSLRGAHRGWVVPVDTLRTVLDVPELVREVEYRPSIRRRMNALTARLSGDERAVARRLADREKPGDFAPLERFAPDRQAMILQAAGFRLRYKEGYDLPREEAKAVARRERALQVKRALLRQDVVWPDPHRPTPPHTGHGTGLFRLGGGYGAHGSFEELTWRASLHDVLADQTGFAPETQIEMLALTLRFENASQNAYMEQLDLVDIVSLAPWEGWTRQLSWKLALGWETPHEIGCHQWDCGFFGMRGGPGLAFQTEWLEREVYYAFADLGAGTGPPFADWFRLEAGGSAGVLFNLTRFWRWQLEGTYRWTFAGGAFAPDSGYRLQAGQNFTLSRNLELRLTGLTWDFEYYEAAGMLGVYF